MPRVGAVQAAQHQLLAQKPLLLLLQQMILLQVQALVWGLSLSLERVMLQAQPQKQSRKECVSLEDLQIQQRVPMQVRYQGHYSEGGQAR